MVFLFRDKSIINVFFLIVLSVVVHAHLFLLPPQLFIGENDGMISLLLRQYLLALPSTALVLIYQAIIVLQAIRLNMVMSDFRMFQSTNYTTAMTYVLLSGFIIQWCGISSALISNSLVLWVFIKLSRLYNNPSPRTLLFNIGLLVALMSIAYHPTAILVLVVLFALAVVRPFHIAEWLVLLMGIIIPFYFLAAYLFLNDSLSNIMGYLPMMKLHLPLLQIDEWLMAALIYLFIALLFGLFFWQKYNNRLVIQIRKNWSVMMVLLLILLPVPFIFFGAGIESAILSLIPLTAFITNAYGYPKRFFIPNLLFWLGVVLIVHNNWIFFKK